MAMTAYTSSMKVRKAVIAAAGFGTRFLPQTKAMPKEMLPLIDKPIIQYIVEELVAVGIEDIVIVTGYSKRSIEDHFDKPSEDLIANLKMGGPSKEPLLREVESIAEMANFLYVRQKGVYGNGTPLLNVEHIIGDEPFIYTWGDDFFKSDPLRFSQMIDLYNEFGCTIMSAMHASTDEDYNRYGFASGDLIREGLIDTKRVIEKPGKANAPSTLATVSGYLLTPDIFPYLHKVKNTLEPDKELYSGDAIMEMIDDGKRVLTYEIQNGKYYDVGNKIEYIKTMLDFSLNHEELGEPLRQYLKGIM